MLRLQDTPPFRAGRFIFQGGKKAADFFFAEDGNQGTQRHAEDPIPDDLIET
jgi:hypothetical protein